MKLSKQELIQNGIKKYHYDFVLPSEIIDSNPLIISAKTFEIDVTTQYVSMLTLVDIKVKGEMVLASTRSLRKVPYSLNEADHLTVAYEKSDTDEDFYYLEDDSLNLDDVVTSLIISSLPTKILSEDDEEYFTVDGYEVISEEEYNRRKAKNNPFSNLVFDEKNN